MGGPKSGMLTLSVQTEGISSLPQDSSWRLSVRNRLKEYTFTVDIMERRYEFGPIVLRPELVPELSNPSGLKLYEKPGAKDARRFLGTTFKAIQQNGDYARVQTAEGTSGWVDL